MESRILFLICTITATVCAAILLVGYGELRGARECAAIVTSAGVLP